MRDAAALIDLLETEGMSPERILAVVKGMGEAAGAGREVSKGALRTRRWRERKASQSVTETSPNVTVEASQASHTVSSPASPPSSPLRNPLTSTLPPSPSKPLASLARSNDWPNDFRDQFWGAYPKRVSKGAAMRALERIWKADKVAFSVVLNAVRLYAEHVRHGDPKYTAHPATWLNEGRWDDELPAPPMLHATGPPRSPVRNGFAALAMEGLHDAADQGFDHDDAGDAGSLFAAVSGRPGS